MDPFAASVASAIDCLRAADTDALYDDVIKVIRDHTKGMVPPVWQNGLANGLLLKITARHLAETAPVAAHNHETLIGLGEHAGSNLAIYFLGHFDHETAKFKGCK